MFLVISANITKQFNHDGCIYTFTNGSDTIQYAGLRVAGFNRKKHEINRMYTLAWNMKRGENCLFKKKHAFLTVFQSFNWPSEVGRHFEYKIWVYV